MALEGKNEFRLNGEVILSLYWCMLMLLEHTQKISYSAYLPDFISNALKDGQNEEKHQARSFNWDESMAERKMQVKIVDAFYKLQQLNHLFPLLTTAKSNNAQLELKELSLWEKQPRIINT